MNGADISKIARHLNRNRTSIRQKLYAMVDAGQVLRVRGSYYPAEGVQS